MTGLHVVLCVEYLLQLAQFFIQGMSVLPETSTTTASRGLWLIHSCCLQYVDYIQISNVSFYCSSHYSINRCFYTFSVSLYLAKNW